MRTNLAKGFANDRLFAGHCVIILMGCGTDCVSGYVGDARNGRIYNFPLGGEGNLVLQLDYRPNSRLVKARWNTSEDTDAACAGADLIWSGAAFTQSPLRTLPGRCAGS